MQTTTDAPDDAPANDTPDAAAPTAHSATPPVSRAALALAVICSLCIIGAAQFWKQALVAKESAEALQTQLTETEPVITRLTALARLGDPRSLPALRDRDYDFVVNNYGFEYEGRTGDLIDEHILIYGLWEKGLAFFMRDYLANRADENAVFIDVGCNAGHHSLFLASHAAAVHGFDPYPPAIERFQRMIDRNKMTNVTVHPVGLGDQDGEIPFFAPVEKNFGSGTFNAKWAKQDRNELALRIVRGDDWLAEKNITNIALIKIDIEGYEKPALIGLRKTLEAERPVVFVEVTTGPEASIATVDEFQGLFPSDYEYIAVLEYLWTTPADGMYLTRPFDKEEAEAFFKSTGQGMVVAYPAEHREWIPNKPYLPPNERKKAAHAPLAATDTALVE